MANLHSITLRYSRSTPLERCNGAPAGTSRQHVSERAHTHTHIYLSIYLSIYENETLINILSVCLSVYLPIRLNPRRGHQTGSGEPSAGG